MTEESHQTVVIGLIDNILPLSTGLIGRLEDDINVLELDVVEVKQ